MSNRDQATSLIDRGWRGYWENPLEYDPASASIPSDPRGIPPLPPYTYQPRPAPQSLLMRPPASMAYAPSFLPYTTANPYYSSSSYPAQTVPLNVFEATSGQSEPARVYYPPGEPPLLNQYYTTHPHNPHFHDEYLPRPMITVPSSAHIPPHPIYQYPRPMHTTGMPQEMRPSSSGFQHPTFITPPENEFVAKASYPVFSPSAMPLIEAQNHPPISSWPSTPPILAPNFNAAESYPRPHDTQESRSSMHTSIHSPTPIREPSQPTKRILKCPWPDCTKTFTRKFNCIVHQKTHTRMDFFPCPHDDCSREFARRHDLLRHERMHTNEKPFVCRHCGAGWGRSDALRRHMARCTSA